MFAPQQTFEKVKEFPARKADNIRMADSSPERSLHTSEPPIPNNLGYKLRFWKDTLGLLRLLEAEKPDDLVIKRDLTLVKEAVRHQEQMDRQPPKMV